MMRICRSSVKKTFGFVQRRRAGLRIIGFVLGLVGAGGLLVQALPGLFVFRAPEVQAQAAGPNIVLNEIFWMGSSASSADEWVELRNLTDQPVDLSNWKLTKKSSGSESQMLVFPAGAVVPANGYYLISNYSSTSTNSMLNRPPDLVDTAMALVNSALQIKLYDGAGTLIDTADDGSGNPLAGKLVSAEKIFWSMERNPIPDDGVRVESWHTASRGTGFKDGATERGTPGTANSNGLPIASAGSDLSGAVGQSLNFDASDSSDPEGQLLSFHWTFGDGASGSGPTPEHAYAVAGEFTAVVTVSDGVDTATDVVAVKISAAPAAVSTTPATSSPPASSVSPPPGGGKVKPKTSCQGIKLSELLVNPAGVDDGEFVELFNPTKKTVSLAGCTLWLNEKRRYVFLDSAIAPNQFFVLEKSVSKLSLTNTGGALRLENSDAATLDTLEYSPAPENESWALVGQAWGWTNRVTKGTKNLGPVDEEVAEKPGAKKDEAKPVQAVTLAEVQTLEAGALVKVQGTVTTTADVLASRTVYLQDDTGALQALLAEEARRPVVGDMVELVATVRTYQGRKRVSVKTGDIKIITSGRAVEPKKVSLDQLSPDLADQLVTVEGVMSSASGAKILIDDGSGEGEVYLKSSTGIVKPKMASGDRVYVVGIVNVTTAGIKVLPRTSEDLRVERVLGVVTANTKASQPVRLATAPDHQTLWYWVVVGVGVLAASAKPAYEAWKRRQASKGVA